MKKMFALAGASLMLAACATPSTYVGGALFSQTKQPMLVTANSGSKVGRACATNILGIYISGDMSIEAAKKNGRITKVASVDREIKSYAVWAEACTVVKGN